MSADSSSPRATVRVLVVFALAAFVLAVSLPDLRRIWEPLGLNPFAADVDNVVVRVSASVVDSGGLNVGDHIDVTAIKPEDRLAMMLENSTLRPGQAKSLAYWRGAQKHFTTIISEPETTGSAGKLLIAARLCAGLLFVVIGAALVLLRPSIATWAFYIYCLGLNPTAISVAFVALPLPWNWAAYLFNWTLSSAAWVGVALFATLFLHEQPTGWRKGVLWLSPFAFIVLSGLNNYVSLATGWFGWRAKAADDWSNYLIYALVAVSLYGLVATYLSSRGTDRQRIRWVVLGFAIALVAGIVLIIIVREAPLYFVTPYWVYASLQLLPVAVPITVGYAVIRHRVIDVSFVVSRALVYGVLTALLVVIFSLIDWFFTDYLRAARLGTVAEVGAVIAFGLWFNGLHKRVDTLIDATFFRQRHKAEVQLARIAGALPRAPTAETVAQCLVNEPVRALSLASAALFKRNRDGVFIREESEGWATHDLPRLDAKDDLFLTLAEAEEGPLSTYDHPWRTHGVPTGAARPALALPVIVRRDLAAIVFYGSHLHGEALDPDEVKAIAGLAAGAAAAYDHLEAEAMKRELESMRALLGSVR